MPIHTNTHSLWPRLLLMVLVLAGMAVTQTAHAQTDTPPVITLQPVNQTVNVGESANFNAAASGFPPPAVQWQIGNEPTGNFINIAGATLPFLSLPGLNNLDGRWVRAVFTNRAGAATTDAAQLTVLGAPMISQQPADQTVNEGDFATFSAEATGSPRPSANWQVSTDNGHTWTDYIDNAEEISFNTFASDNGKQFRAIFTNSVGSATTEAATLTVNFPPAIVTQPADQVAPPGQTALFSAAASGNPSPAAQWQVSTDGGATWTDIPGATAATLSFTVQAGDGGNQYRAVFTNSLGSATTDAAALTTGVAPAITTQPADQSANDFQEVSFSAAASGNPVPTVQWQVSTDGGATWNDVPGATAATLTFTVQPGDNGNQYRAIFTNSLGSATTNAATLTLNISPLVTTQPANQTVDPGQTANFSAAAFGSPDPTVQWQVSTDNGATFSDIPGATTATLSFTAQVGDNGNQYLAVFTNVAGSAASAAATLLVSGPPKVTQQPPDQAVNAGGTPRFNAAAIGDPAPTVQWQVSADGGATWTDVPGATETTLSFTAQASDNGKQYRAVFSNSLGSTASNPANLVVNFAPAITTQPSDQVVDAGQTANFSAAASGYPPPSPQWQVSTDGGATWTDIPGAIAPALSFSAQAGDNGNQYRAVFTNGLGTATTNAATLTVTIRPGPGPNVPPSVGDISGPAGPTNIENQVVVSATFSDPDVLDTHTALWDWGDGTTSAGDVVESNGSGTASGSHSYSTPGVYTIVLTVTDNDGGSAQASTEVIVYAANGGFVVGAGWLDSPPGSVMSHPDASGRAGLAFLAQYPRRSSTVPEGHTEFRFVTPRFTFVSRNYDWLVISGTQAQFVGSGRINGAGDFGFLLAVSDGRAAGGSQDTVRLKIWNKNDGNAVVYDSQPGAPNSAEPTTILDGVAVVFDGQLLGHSNAETAATDELLGIIDRLFLPVLIR